MIALISCDQHLHVEALSFGTLSKCIERGAQDQLSDAVATSLGAAKAGFAYRVRALVYVRNRCAHHSRIWNHSIIDAGPTPNNVRTKAKPGCTDSLA